MKLREIYFRELKNGQLGATEYPFTSEEKSEWEDLKELADHLFSPLDFLVSGQWVETFETDDDGIKNEETIREYKFPQF